MSKISFEERWLGIMTFMALTDRFVNNILMMMDKIENNNIYMMGIKVEPLRIILEYNRKNLEPLRDSDICFILTHEVYHVVLHHSTKRKKANDRDNRIYNHACDMAINHIIPLDREQRYRTRPYDKDGKFLGVLPEQYNYPNHLSSNQYFLMLKKDIEKEQEKRKKKSIGQDQGTNTGDDDEGDDEGQDQNTDTGDEGKGQDQGTDTGDDDEGEGQGQGTDTGDDDDDDGEGQDQGTDTGDDDDDEGQDQGTNTGDDNDDQDKSTISKLLDDIISGNNKLLDDHSGWKEEDIINEMIRNKILLLMSQSSSWKNVPGELQALIVAALETKVSWERYLKYHIGNIISPTYSRTITKPDKRFGYPYLGKKRNYSDKKMVAIDTSGSISNENLSKFLAEINKLVEIMEIDLVLFDTSITLGPILYHSKHINFDFKGRGGTNFAPVFKLAEEKHYQSVIILTDGCAPAIEYPKGVQDVLWVLTNKHECPPVDWGIRVNIEE